MGDGRGLRPVPPAYRCRESALACAGHGGPGEGCETTPRGGTALFRIPNCIDRETRTGVDLMVGLLQIEAAHGSQRTGCRVGASQIQIRVHSMQGTRRRHDSVC